jgi:hypothetical protein
MCPRGDLHTNHTAPPSRRQLKRRRSGHRAVRAPIPPALWDLIWDRDRGMVGSVAHLLIYRCIRSERGRFSRAGFPPQTSHAVSDDVVRALSSGLSVQ